MLIPRPACMPRVPHRSLASVNRALQYLCWLTSLNSREHGLTSPTPRSLAAESESYFPSEPQNSAVELSTMLYTADESAASVRLSRAASSVRRLRLLPGTAESGRVRMAPTHDELQDSQEGATCESETKRISRDLSLVSMEESLGSHK